MKKFTGFKQYFNEPLGSITVGTILTRANGMSKNFQVASNLFRSITKKKEDYIEIGLKQDRFYSSEASTTLMLGAETDKLSDIEATIKFSSKNNAVVIIRNGITTDLFYNDLATDLEKLWNRRGYMKNAKNFFLVTSVIRSNRAKVFYSKQNNTSIRLKHKNNIPIAENLDLLNAEFALGREVRSVRMMDILNPCTILFSMARWHNRKQRFVPF
jgi:hypothetical protein